MKSNKLSKQNSSFCEWVRLETVAAHGRIVLCCCLNWFSAYPTDWPEKKIKRAPTVSCCLLHNWNPNFYLERWALRRWFDRTIVVVVDRTNKNKKLLLLLQFSSVMVTWLAGTFLTTSTVFFSTPPNFTKSNCYRNRGRLNKKMKSYINIAVFTPHLTFRDIY